MSNQTMDIYNTAPTGRMSANKLRDFATTINEELKKIDSPVFCRVQNRNFYYAVDLLTPDQYAFRSGVTGANDSGVARVYQCGLSAKDARQALIDFYNDAVCKVELI